MCITSPGGKVIVLDPWLLSNPKTPAGFKSLEALGENSATRMVDIQPGQKVEF